MLEEYTSHAVSSLSCILDTETICWNKGYREGTVSDPSPPFPRFLVSWSPPKERAFGDEGLRKLKNYGYVQFYKSGEYHHNSPLLMKTLHKVQRPVHDLGHFCPIPCCPYSDSTVFPKALDSIYIGAAGFTSETRLHVSVGRKAHRFQALFSLWSASMRFHGAERFYCFFVVTVTPPHDSPPSTEMVLYFVHCCVFCACTLTLVLWLVPVLRSGRSWRFT